ncbi:hypothetical protein RR46_03151 [Papilio xuthus]|uniref:Uncharacterized protein n=1 Tax=Papilio xuthus TaxID=66420 RepID=A0A194Q7L3_PAPXU|nr:hypothetical protein RR46_03151 [Papilio xuthus]
MAGSGERRAHAAVRCHFRSNSVSFGQPRIRQLTGFECERDTNSVCARDRKGAIHRARTSAAIYFFQCSPPD